MRVKLQPVADLAECWDELTPVQQQLMIQHARGLVSFNKMKMLHSDPEVESASSEDLTFQSDAFN